MQSLALTLSAWAVLAWAISDRQQRHVPQSEPAVPPGAAAVLSVLRSSAVLVDAAPLAREAARGYRILAEERAVSVELDLPAGLPAGYADPDLLVQVLGNLLDNAVRFARTRIVLRAEALTGAAAAGRALARGCYPPEASGARRTAGPL